MFNRDQGSRFTGAFTGVLEREGVAICMNGRGGRWRNIKHEDVYLWATPTAPS